MIGNEEITDLLQAWNEGDREAIDKLIPLVESNLRRIAHHYMRRESPNHSLQTTALINETYIKLVGQRDANWQNREHFFAMASRLMRRILINYARDWRAAKRGGNMRNFDLEEVVIFTPEKSAELIALDEALEKLAEIDQLKSQIVEMRYFGGMTVNETAKVLEIAPSTVSLHWRLAKAWLARKIRGENYKSE